MLLHPGKTRVAVHEGLVPLRPVQLLYHIRCACLETVVNLRQSNKVCHFRACTRHMPCAATQLHFDYGQDVFLIREAVMGGERGGGAGQVHLSQAASLPVLLPPPRERSTAVTGKLHCPEKRGLLACAPSPRLPPPSAIPRVPPFLRLLTRNTPAPG